MSASMHGRNLGAVAVGRLRAALLRARGAKIGAKSRIGRRFDVTTAAALRMGTMCEFEHDVFVKVASDGAGITLGDRVFVGRGVEFDISVELTIGSHTLIAPGCFITDHSHIHARAATIDSQGCVSSAVRIGRDVWIGANAIILPGVTIEDGAIIGAGAVVNRRVEAYTKVAGVPARALGARA